MTWPFIRTTFLLLASNLFMTTAWYGHLKFRSAPILLAIAVSWLIALPEYALQVPANRLGYGSMTAYQLKVLQECISILVFIGFAWVALGESPNWKQLVSFLFILGAVAFAFNK